MHRQPDDLPSQSVVHKFVSNWVCVSMLYLKVAGRHYKTAECSSCIQIPISIGKAGADVIWMHNTI